MGLDMYLDKVTYLGWRGLPLSIQVLENNKPHPHIDTSKIKAIKEEVFYWRKANWIHAWFIKNCANGVDDCTDIFLAVETLQELLHDCKEVLRSLDESLATQVEHDYGLSQVGEGDIRMVSTWEDTSVAMRLLPPQSGFFWGADVISDYYYDTIKSTVLVLEQELAKHSIEGYWPDYIYRASW